MFGGIFLSKSQTNPNPNPSPNLTRNDGSYLLGLISIAFEFKTVKRLSQTDMSISAIPDIPVRHQNGLSKWTVRTDLSCYTAQGNSALLVCLHTGSVSP